MKYMLLIQSGGVEGFDELPENEQNAIYGEYMAISEAPGVSDGNQLQPAETATTVRVEDGKTPAHFGSRSLASYCADTMLPASLA